ncbi:MAG: MarR family transcriptional regulator [Alphaproteobacteria bacterium]|nr:MarR family transcriptional regulator [Alphaproteobacteria bacterium]MDB5721327.1 MarR family transcriptional regulator [Alphaproteobacteria bacterium]
MCALVDTNFAFDVAETALAIRREFDRRAAAIGVTRAQWRLLSRLARQGGQRQVELADALDVEPITLCRIIDRLAEAGLVERRADEVDRRAWRIHLTEKAGPIIEDLSTIAETFLDDILVGISPGEQAEVRRVLELVRANVAAGGSSARRVS